MNGISNVFLDAGKYIIDPVCAGLQKFMGIDRSRCT